MNMKNIEIKCACVCCPESDGTVPIALNVITDAKPVTGDVISYCGADYVVDAAELVDGKEYAVKGHRK